MNIRPEQLTLLKIFGAVSGNVPEDQILKFVIDTSFQFRKSFSVLANLDRMHFRSGFQSLIDGANQLHRLFELQIP